MAKSITDKKDTYLVAAEMSVEGNYNMVGDGIINNVPKPSMLERLEEFEQKKKERHKSDRIDDKRERHREARHNQNDR
jgi:hypothetical protein